jgi:RNA polymerase sigma factor (sigma-70 family)
LFFGPEFFTFEIQDFAWAASDLNASDSMTEGSVFGSVTRLIRDLEDGNTDALNSLYKRYFKQLTDVADNRLSRQAGPIVDGEDVALTVLMRLSENVRNAENKGKLPDRESLWLFMLAILHSIVVDLKRRNYAWKRGKGSVHSLSDFVQRNEDGRSPIDIADTTPSHEKLAILRDSVDYLLNQKLKVETTRSVAMLKLEGYSHQEIADKVGMDVKTVSRKMKRIQEVWMQELGTSVDIGGFDDQDTTE